MKPVRSGVLRQGALDRKPVVAVGTVGLLGVVMLTPLTAVHGAVRYPPAPGPMLMRSDVPQGTDRMNMLSAAARMAQPTPRGAPSGRWRVLTGTIAYTDPSQGFAIIGTGVQDTYLARPGDQLPDGSWLREIHPKNVVLEYAGTLETVGLYEPGQATGAVYVQPAPLPARPRFREEILPPPPQLPIASESMPLREEPLPTRARPSEPESSDTPRPSVLPMNTLRGVDAPPGDVTPDQAQPDTPTPAAQDPADEFSDDRRQRAENRRK